MNAKGDFADLMQGIVTLRATLIDPTFLPILPRWFQKAAFSALASIGRRLGYEEVHKPRRGVAEGMDRTPG